MQRDPVTEFPAPPEEEQVFVTPLPPPLEERRLHRDDGYSPIARVVMAGWVLFAIFGAVIMVALAFLP